MRYIISAWIVLSIVFSAATVWAKDRVAIIDVTPRSKDSKKSVPVLRKALKKESSVKVVRVKNLSKKLKSKYKLSKSSLSKGKLRRKYKTRIKKAVRGLDIDALIVVEALEKGKKLQIVILGRDGNQIKNILEPLKSKRLNKRVANTLAEDIGDLIKPPREEEEEPEEEEEDIDDDDDDDDDSEDDGSTFFESEHVLGEVTSVGGGAFFGRRSLRSVTPPPGPDRLPNALTHDAPYFGPMLSFDYATTFFDGDGQFGASLDVGWAPFETQFADDMGQNFALSSSVIRATLNASILYAFTDVFAIGPYAGLDYISVSIASNTTYNGHTYTNLGAGLTALTRPFKQLSVHIGAGYLPSIGYSYEVGGVDTQQNPIPIGIEGSTTGFEARVGLQFHINKPLNLQVSYHYVNIADPEDNPATTTDSFHQGNASLNYAF